MKNILALFLLIIQCGFGVARTGTDITIKLVHNSDPERQTQAQFERILKTYDTSRWIFTKDVAIETGAIPHSHPVLTLNSRHLDNDDLLLSTFVHEQMHWFLDGRQKEVSLAAAELKSAFPSLPTGYPEGADSDESNYEHLIVIYLEYKATQQLIGDTASKKVMTFWMSDHYKKLYSTVWDNQELINSILLKYRLFP